MRTERSVAYIDHNTLQSGFVNADDHRFIRTIAKKIGVRYSRPATASAIRCIWNASPNPAKRSSAPTATPLPAGGIGSLAMGAGGLDVAVAMGGGAYYIPYPKATLVKSFPACAPHGERQGRHP